MAKRLIIGGAALMLMSQGSQFLYALASASSFLQFLIFMAFLSSFYYVIFHYVWAKAK